MSRKDRERLKAKKEAENRGKRRRRRTIRVVSFICMGILLVVLGYVATIHFPEQSAEIIEVAYVYLKGEAMEVVESRYYGDYDIGSPTKQVEMPEIDVQLLTINEYSRPGLATDEITGIVIHYTANPGTTAQENRDYFESLKETHETSVSSNFVIGLEGEIIQCVPTAEVAYASNDRNTDTVSVECCHPDVTGEFTDATYQSLVELVAFLCGKFNLEIDDVIRHYDVTGKDCPKYYVEHEDAWEQFKLDVAEYIEENGVIE